MADPMRADVLIAGGGIVGLTLGLALAGSGFDVALAEPQSGEAVTAAGFDGRASALSYANVRMLERLGLWRHLTKHAQPINDILVSDAKLGKRPSMFSMHFDHHEIGDPLGQMAENRHIRKALLEACANEPRLKILSGLSVVSADRDGVVVMAELSNGASVSSPLIIGAEGRDSPSREAAGISVVSWDYAQTGIVATVAHEFPHGGVAYEHFLPGGPFAILPLPDDEEGHHRSSLVWTEPTANAEALLALSSGIFAQELSLRFGTHLGDVKPIGPRWSYPLRFQLARNTIAQRLALVGDAAQSIHPIAGQGLNLGLKDVAALVETITDAARLGSDIGTAAVLERYQRWRNFDRVSLALGTDALNRLFSNGIGPVRLARDLGLGVVDSLKPLRRFFMRHAGGDVGELPRLLRGEAV